MRPAVAWPAAERRRGCIFFLHYLAQIEHEALPLGVGI